ncbi:MAG TPA: PAS domain S-box protein [Mucilaginibacter sp.]|nr:PAS domain S-box protein [Mucilaginibacter sp.]
MELQNKLDKESEEKDSLIETVLHQEALINGTRDLIWSVDNQLRIITANHSFAARIETITGITPRPGDNVLIEAFGKEQLSKWSSYYARALKGEQFTIKEQAYNPLKKGMEYSLISLSPMITNNGDVFGVACYSKDITPDTLNLMALESTRARLEKILDSSMDMICSIDENDRIVNINAACEKILGYKPGEMIGNRLFDYIYPEDLEKNKTMAASVMAGNEVTDNENRYVRKDGSLVPLMWSARWDPKDRLRYGIARDATERKKSEEALIESEKKYRYLFDKNPLPVLMWDFETLQILDCNEEAIKKYGYSRKELQQMTIRELRPPEDIPLLQEAVKDQGSYGEIHKKNWRHSKKNGEIMYMDITGHLMNFNGRRVSLTLAKDVTESRYYHEMDRLERSVLELNARNDKSLTEIIGIYLSGIEKLHSGLICSMQKVKNGKLHNLSAPSLPQDYLELIEGVSIGDNVGSCGTAAYLKQKVIVTDIATDRRWADYKEIAERYGFTTCWSFPILDCEGNVMATFACYYREKKSPSEAEEHTIERAANIMQVILENHRREKALSTSNERFEFATKATSDIIWDWNLETNEVYYSDNMRHLFGHRSGYNSDNLPFYFENVHPDDRERVVLYPQQVKFGSMVNWSQEYRFRKADGEYAFVLDKGIVIRDENGVGVRMIGAMQDVTLMKQHELRVMEQNERLTEIAQINAHEIRRPVATILGLMQLINKNTIGNEANRELVDYLEAATNELDGVIKRIIDKTVS